jgi:hypothetical protein
MLLSEAMLTHDHEANQTMKSMASLCAKGLVRFSNWFGECEKSQ